MREEIDKIISEELDQLPENEDFFACSRQIESMIETQNAWFYRTEILKTIRGKAKDNPNVVYSEDMNIHELEKILHSLD